MKQEPLGTNFVPAHRANQADGKLNTLLNYFLPEECKIKSRSDYYYVAAIASICVTLICPPCIIVAGYCLYKAKKGGTNE